jgi:hypothetical protein
MLIQWCLKGIPEQKGFSDHEAEQALLDTGLLSAWIRAQGLSSLADAWPQANAALSIEALASHVNDYKSVKAKTPYVSLTAGLMVYDAASRTAQPRPAWSTAVDFATRSGTQDGYVFECWVMLPPNPAPELPGFAEDVRDLNLHRNVAYWHEQGEIAAKLGIPRRQIRRVLKYGPDLKPQALAGCSPADGLFNPDFVAPERVSNIRSLT